MQYCWSILLDVATAVAIAVAACPPVDVTVQVRWCRAGFRRLLAAGLEGKAGGYAHGARRGVVCGRHASWWLLEGRGWGHRPRAASRLQGRLRQGGVVL